MALKGAILVERGALGRFTPWFFDSSLVVRYFT
jgi:hypothetical protein